MAADGSIIIDTKIDDTDIDSQIKGISSSIKKSFAGMRDIMQGPVAMIKDLLHVLNGLKNTLIGNASAIEDATAGFTPLMGGVKRATELVSELNKTSATTPFQFENISSAAKQLLPVMNQDIEKTISTFRMLGDTAGGNAQKLESITRGYTKAMLKNKVDMESLNMISEAGVPIYTELASSMGVTVAQMSEMSSKGEITSDDLTAAFQKMTSEGGIFFKGMEIASQTYSGVMSTLQDNINLAAAAIGNAFLPMVKDMAITAIDVVKEFTAWATEGDNLTNMLEILGLTIAGVGSAMAVWFVATNYQAIFMGIATAIRAINTALLTNPVVAIAAVITAVLIPALIYTIRHWEDVKDSFNHWSKMISFWMESAGNNIKYAFTVSINSVKIAFLSLVQIISDKVLGAVGKLLEAMGKMPFVGEKFAEASGFIRGLADNIHNATEEIKQDDAEAIRSAGERRDEIKAAIEDEKAAYLELREEKEKTSEPVIEKVDAGAAIEEQKTVVRELSVEEKALAEARKKYHDQLSLNMNQATDGYITQEEALNANILAAQQFADTLYSMGASARRGESELDKTLKSILTEINSGKIQQKAETESTELGKTIAIGISDGISNNVQYVYNEIKSATRTVGDILVDGFSVVKSVLKAMSTFDPSTIITDLQEFADGLLDFFTTDIATLPVYFDLGVTIIADMLTGIMDNMPTIITSFNNLIKGIVNTIVTDGPAIIDSIFTILTGIITVIGENADRIASAVGTIISVILNSFITNGPTIIKTIIKILTSIITVIGDNAPEFIAAAGTIIISLVEGLIENANEIVTAISNVLVSIIDYVSEHLAEFVILGAQLIIAMITGLLDNLPEIIVSIIDALPDIIVAFNMIIPLLIAAAPLIIAALIEALITSIAEGIPALILAVVELFTDIIDAIWLIFSTIADIGPDIIQGLIDGIVNFFPNLWSGIKGLFEDFIDSILSFFGIHSPSTVFANIGINLIKGLINGIISIGTNLWSFVSSIFTGLIKSITNIFSGALSLGKNLIYWIVNGIRSIGSNLWSFVSSIFTGLISRISSVFSAGISLGKALMSGIISGIKSLWSSLTSLATSIVTTITSAAASAASTASSAISNAVGSATSTASNVASTVSSTVSNVSSWVKSWFASGTDSAPGGLSVVGEQGPELVNLSRGSSVLKASDTEKIMNSAFSVIQALSGYTPGTAGVSSQNITIYNRMTGTIEADSRQLAQVVYDNIDEVAI